MFLRRLRAVSVLVNLLTIVFDIHSVILIETFYRLCLTVNCAILLFILIANFFHLLILDLNEISITTE